MGPVRMLAAAGVVGVLLAAGIWSRVAPSPHGEVVGDAPSHEGWQTLEHDDVRVDVPKTWKRLDTDGCELRVERWAPPDASPCDGEEGLAFHDSSTFDAAFEPAVRRTAGHGVPAWSGYVLVGGFAVHVSYDERDVVRSVLASARVTRVVE